MDRSGKIPGAEMPIEIRLDNHDGALRLGATVTATLTLKTQEPLLTIPVRRCNQRPTSTTSIKSSMAARRVGV